MKELQYNILENKKGISHLEIVNKKYSKHIKQKRINFNTPEVYTLDMQGTPFQKKVWKALTRIKRGDTKTYSEVACMIGRPTAIRAVASAIAKNNIAILIPCHRVVRSDGTLGEYRWGKKLKKQLLQYEGVTRFA